MIVRARSIVTMDAAPIEDGAVWIENGRIVQVARYRELRERVGTGKRRGDEELIDLGDSVLLPGLINAHCHLDYTCLRGTIQPRRSFADWIRTINSAKAQLSGANYSASILDGIAEAQRFGSTSMLNLEAFPGLIAELPSVPLRIWWCAELIDVAGGDKPSKLVAAAVTKLKSSAANRGGFGLAPHAPFTASRALYRECAKAARRDDLLLTTHLAESAEEMEMFQQKSGALFDFLSSIGRPIDDCGDTTPLSVFLDNLLDPRSSRGEEEAPVANWVVAHLNELSERDCELLSKFRARFSIVHCPRSHAYFGREPFTFERVDRIGLNICLGTDSLASNDDLSLFREMREFSRANPTISSRRILEMITVNAAKALGQADRLGKIRADYQADMIAIPSEGIDPYDAVAAFDAEVPWAMIGGKVVKFFRFPLSFSQT